MWALQEIEIEAKSLGIPLPFSVWAQDGAAEYPEMLGELDAYLWEEVDPILRVASPETMAAVRLLIMRLQPALSVWYVVRRTVEENNDG